MQKYEGDFLRINVPIGDVNPGDAVRVLFTYRAIKHTRDYEVLRSLLPSSSITLTVHLPPRTPTVGANALHRASLGEQIKDVDNGYYEWVLDQAILPHQAIIFWWDMGSGTPSQVTARRP